MSDYEAYLYLQLAFWVVASALSGWAICWVIWQIRVDMKRGLTATVSTPRADMVEIPRVEIQATIDTLRRLIAERDRLQYDYDELIYQVGRKYPGETRHQTALRYLREAERQTTEQHSNAMDLGEWGDD